MLIVRILRYSFFFYVYFMIIYSLKIIQNMLHSPFLGDGYMLFCIGVLSVISRETAILKVNNLV